MGRRLLNKQMWQPGKKDITLPYEQDTYLRALKTF